MKENIIKITINNPIDEVFEFTTNPKNTHIWIEHLKEEQTNEYPPQIGTVYRNHDGSENWDEYEVIELEKNKIFTLRSKDGIYNVRYTYTFIDANSTEMGYYEWVTEGELDNPFRQEVLEKLKKVMEKKGTNL